MSPSALRDLYADYSKEMEFWSNVLTEKIDFITISEIGRQSRSFSQSVVIKQLKKIAVWRMDAIEDVLEEINAAPHRREVEEQTKPWPEPYIGDFGVPEKVKD
jgi:hypothetical protein